MISCAENDLQVVGFPHLCWFTGGWDLFSIGTCRNQRSEVVNINEHHEFQTDFPVFQRPTLYGNPKVFSRPFLHIKGVAKDNSARITKWVLQMAAAIRIMLVFFMFRVKNMVYIYKYVYIYMYWLVGGWALPSEKSECVSWDDDIPKPPTRGIYWILSSIPSWVEPFNIPLSHLMKYWLVENGFPMIFSGNIIPNKFNHGIFKSEPLGSPKYQW